MTQLSYQETLVSAQVYGPAVTALGPTSILQPQFKMLLPGSAFWNVGKRIKMIAQGRISNVVTTPGTGRFTVTVGGVTVFYSGAFNLNTVAKTNVPWWLEIALTCRAVGSGTSANLMGQAQFASESVVGSPLPTVGGNGSLLIPVGAPVVGGGFDSTANSLIDLLWTQTVTTGSIQLHQYLLEALN